MSTTRSRVTAPTISTFSVTKGGRIAETRACFESWDLEMSLDDNLRRILDENLIQANTDAWLREMGRILQVRFGDIERHRNLIRLAQSGMALDSWSQILLWHLTMREQLLSDFLESWLFPRKQEGMLLVRSNEVKNYLAGLKDRGVVSNDWSLSTIGRMASGLPSYAADFGLLSGHTVKEFCHFQIRDDALLYILLDVKQETSSADQALGDVRWRRFLMSRDELEHDLLRLHQSQQIQYEVAGSVISLETTFNGVDDYVEHLVKH